MNNNNRRNKKIVKNFKDYLVPIIGVLIVFIVILNFIFSGNSANTNKTNIVNNVPLEVLFQDQSTDASIVYASGDKKKITQNTELYKGEKLQIGTAGNLTLNFPNENGSISLNRLGELKYNDDGSYTLLSSDLWVNSKEKVQVELRYAKISSSPNSVFNLSQNEVASSLYVVSGNVEITSTSGNKTNIQKGQKISIMRNDATDKNVDLSLKREDIDDYTKNDDWFIKNNGSFFLNKVEESQSGSTTGSGNTNTGSGGSSSLTGNSEGFQYISFNLADESDVTTDSINLDGTVLDDVVYKVEIDGKTATVNSQDKTFSLKGVKLNSRINNIVYRVFDESNKLLSKGVLTLYYANGGNGTTTNTSSSNGSNLAGVENYSLTNSPLYKIISPKQNPYTTSESVVMIEGTVPARTVQKIIVNGFQLQAFPANGTYWKYFANSSYGNLKEGLNIYKISYYGADDKLIYENTYSIIKEAPKVNNVPETTTNTTSNETITNSGTSSSGETNQ